MASEPGEASLEQPAPDRRRASSLDLPGLLPVAVLAATLEFLLSRVVTLAARFPGGQGELLPWMGVVARVGTFAENLALVLALLLLAEAVVFLVRDPSFGPITHRITVAGFAATTIAICGASAVVRVGAEPALMGHAAAVLFSSLLVLGLLWHRVEGRLLVAGVLVLLPTLLRFYASCALSVPLLRTETAAPLYAYHGAEVLAVAVALASPFVIAGFWPSDLGKRSSIMAMALASLPAVALAAALGGSSDQVRSLTRAAVGFEMIVPPAAVVYPAALFAFLLTVSALALPGLSSERTRSEERIGYGLALLFLAGLDGLSGAVLRLGANPADVPALVQYLLEGNWTHLTREQQSLVGPPVRELGRVALLALGYAMIARGIHGRASATPRASSEGGPS